MALIPFSEARRAEIAAKEAEQRVESERLSPFPEDMVRVSLDQLELPIRMHEDRPIFKGQNQVQPVRQRPDLSTIGLAQRPPQPANDDEPEELGGASSTTVPAASTSATATTTTAAPGVRMERVVLPVDPEIVLVKQFLDRAVHESSFERPGAVEGTSKIYEIDEVGGVGRKGRAVVVCVKWKGWPWADATWEPMASLPPETKQELVDVWGPLGKIRSDSRPLGAQNDEDEDEDEDDNA